MEATSIQDLPSQILYNIFKISSTSSPSPHAIDTKFYKICSKWCKIIEENVCNEETFVSSPDGPGSNSGYLPISSFSNTLVRSCYFQNIINSPIPNPLNHGSLINKMSILEQISSHNFETLINSATNLQSLTLEQWSLYGLTKPDLQCLESLSNLEMLTVDGENFNLKHAVIDDWNHNTNQIVRLLDQASHPKLQLLALKAVDIVHSGHEPYIMTAMWSCLVKHQTSLKHLTVETHPVKSRKDPEFRKKKMTKAPECEGSKTEIPRLKLISLFFGGQYSTQSRNSQRLFRTIFETQIPTVEHVFCDFLKITNPMRMNDSAIIPAHLESIELRLCGHHDGIIDCRKYFAKCTGLHVLSLSADEKPVPSWNWQPELVNIHALPCSLIIVRIRRLNVASTDATFLSSQFLNLELLELLEIGHQRGLGLPFDDLIRVLGEKKIRTLIMMKAWNYESVDEIENNPDANSGQTLLPMLFDRIEESDRYLMLEMDWKSNNYKIRPSKEVEQLDYFRGRQDLEHSLQFFYPLGDDKLKVESGVEGKDHGDQVKSAETSSEDESESEAESSESDSDKEEGESGSDSDKGESGSDSDKDESESDSDEEEAEADSDEDKSESDSDEEEAEAETEAEAESETEDPTYSPGDDDIPFEELVAGMIGGDEGSDNEWEKKVVAFVASGDEGSESESEKKKGAKYLDNGVKFIKWGDTWAMPYKKEAAAEDAEASHLED